MDFGSILTGIGSLLGPGLSFFGQSQANKANSLDARIQAGMKYGLSPLALLGGSVQAGPAQNVFSGAENLGQNLGRAFQASQSTPTRMDALAERNMELRNSALETDIAAQQMKLAHESVVAGAVGRPPAFNAGMEGSPYFGPVNPFGGPHPTLQRNADGTVSRTKEQAEIAFSGDPVAMATNALESLQRAVPDPSPSPTDIYNWWRNLWSHYPRGGE